MALALWDLRFYPIAAPVAVGLVARTRRASGDAIIPPRR